MVRTIHREIWVNQGQESVPLDFFLPRATQRVLGLHVGVIDRIAPVESEVMHFGEYSLSLDGRKGAILSGDIDYHHNPPSRSSDGFDVLYQPLSICTKQSPRIGGYYHDLNGQALSQKPFIPYRVRFSFQLLLL